MKVQEVYKRYALKVNKNDTNEGINILPATFVLLFNSEALLWLGTHLNDNADNVNLNWAEGLLETDKKIENLGKVSNYFEFELPGDVFKYVGSFSLVDKDACKDIVYFHFEKNALNKNAFIQDDFSGPQLDYEEGPIILSNNKLKVFVKDFDINESFLTYYRKPRKIDMEGYIGFDGPSKNVDPDLSDENIESILNRLALEASREEKDSEGFQFSVNRVQQQP